jgi:ClpP class serine protease
LCDEVAALAAEKPTFAFCDDMVASAGVSVASQANKRFANNNTAMYGAMGTYSVLVDSSGAADKMGVQVHVIKAGDFKGMGTDGAPITQAQLDEAQRLVNAMNEGYLQKIASGLGKPLEMIRSLADGRVHMAADAVGMGLIDGVQSFEQTYAALVAATAGRKSMSGATPAKGKLTMETPVKTPATLAELKNAFKNSTADWREQQIEANATIEQAAVNYAAHVEAKAAADAETHKAELEAAKKGAGKNESNGLGHRIALSDRRQTSNEFETGNAIDDFNAAVSAIAGDRPNMHRRQQAIQLVAARNPELHQAYLLATNGTMRQTRILKEKFETAGAK